MASQAPQKRMSLGNALVHRFNDMMTDMGTLTRTWEDLADYIMPRRVTRINRTFEPEGRKLRDKIFDATAPQANVTLGSFIASTLTNQALRWFSLIVDDEELSQDRDVRVWLDKSSNIIFRNLNASNFNVEIQETYQDLGAFGTSAIILEEKDRAETGGFGGFIFRTESIGTYTISEGPDGRVDTVFRNLKMPVITVAQKFGEENLSKALRIKLQQHPSEKIEVLHAIFPRDLPVSASFNSIKTRMPVASVYVEKESKKVIHQGGFREMPWFVTRWSKGSGEIWGRGPGHTAYPDIRTLNKALEITFRAWGKIVDPPINVLDDTVIGRISSIPAAINVVTDPNAIQPWKHEGRFDVNNVLMADLRTSIRRAFFADQLQLPDKTIITATEVERRLELMQQVLGPVVGRLEFELLSPMIDRAFSILLRAGEFPPMPQRLQQFVQQRRLVKIRVQYEGTLARAQRAANLSAISRFINIAGPIVQIKPEALDNVDVDEMIRIVGRDTNIPATIMRDTFKIKQDRVRRQQQQQQILQQQQIAQGSEVARNFGQAAKAFEDSNVSQEDITAGLQAAEGAQAVAAS